HQPPIDAPELLGEARLRASGIEAVGERHALEPICERLITALSARLRGERARASRAGEVGRDGGLRANVEAHLTLPAPRAGPLPLPASRGEGNAAAVRPQRHLSLTLRDG